MSVHRVVAWIFGAGFIACLALAYGAAVAGLIGWLDARAVSLWTISGGAAAFLAAIGYFFALGQYIKRAIIVLEEQPR